MNTDPKQPSNARANAKTPSMGWHRRLLGALAAQYKRVTAPTPSYPGAVRSDAEAGRRHK